ncbi:MAG: trypsin-like serine peptidase [Planctomycetota bacterium]
MSHRTHRIAIFCGAAAVVALAATAASAQGDPAPFVDGTTFAGFPVRVARPPTPRSLDLEDGFAGQNVDLPALAANDVVYDDGSTGVSGRIYDIFARSGREGQWTDLPEGGRLWTLAVRSPNAAGLRLRFEPFLPPSGAELIVYSAENPTVAFGPFGRGAALEGLPFWSPTVYGQEVRVEYYLPPPITQTAVGAELTLTGAMQRFPGEEVSRGGNCQIDVTCDASWATAALAVAHIHYLRDSDLTERICSGAMLNRNPAPYDTARLFLTAAHCIDTGSEASTIEVYWFYQTTTCNGTPPTHDPNSGTVVQTNGSYLLARHLAADVTILGLRNDMPAGLLWAGWDSNSISNPTSATMIHHPSGVRKSISYGEFEGTGASWRCSDPIEETRRFDLSNGGQEGGSSGAPVFDNSAQRVRAVASCSADPGCDPGENTWEGRLHKGYSSLKPYLSSSSNVWVDESWGGSEKGTESEPFEFIIRGYYGVHSPGVIHIEAGNYPPVSLIGHRSMLLTAENGTVVIGN